jgi:hypothetical protein
MEPVHEVFSRPVWPKRKPARRTAPDAGADHILSDQRTASGELLGPYETAYDLSPGYGMDREIVTP